MTLEMRWTSCQSRRGAAEHVSHVPKHGRLIQILKIVYSLSIVSYIYSTFERDWTLLEGRDIRLLAW